MSHPKHDSERVSFAHTRPTFLRTSPPEKYYNSESIAETGSCCGIFEDPNRSENS